MTAKWYLSEKSYFSGFEKQEIEKTYEAFDEFLEQSPEAYDVYVGDNLKRVIVQSTADYNKRRVLFKEDDLEWGDLVDFEDDVWLVSERPFFNQMYEKSHILLCGNEMTFEYEGEREIIGWTSLNQPIFGDEPEIITVAFPCVVESVTNIKTPLGESVNIPNGDVALLIPNTDSELIEINNQFKVFDKPYRISGIDRSQTRDDIGVLTIVAERVQN